MIMYSKTNQNIGRKRRLHKVWFKCRYLIKNREKYTEASCVQISLQIWNNRNFTFKIV